MKRLILVVYLTVLLLSVSAMALDTPPSGGQQDRSLGSTVTVKLESDAQKARSSPAEMLKSISETRGCPRLANCFCNSPPHSKERINPVTFFVSRHVGQVDSPKARRTYRC